ncbi:MAG: heparan-alpha-glucosaminide N-acetyltransferase domain-containing protein, partial [Gammaproteobacteria bacterium]
MDVLRGVAIVLMIAYHFCFDLNYYRVLSIDFNNAPFWLGARA